MLESKAPAILRLDIAGRPLSWIHWQDAVCLYVKDLIAWEGGQHSIKISGGHSRLTGEQSLITINSIVAVKGMPGDSFNYNTTPHLTNRELFQRDGHICLYCGQPFSDGDLTRDHIIPRSQGGADSWTNVVAACRRCNTSKGGRTPEQAHMHLLAVPFVPNKAEYLALKNRRILADQMEFLRRQFRNERLLEMVA